MSIIEKVQPKDIEYIKLDGEDDSISIGVMVEVDDGFNASFEETIYFDEHTPQYLKDAATEFRVATLRALKERVVKAKEVPCATCTGACCRGWMVRVTAEDVVRLRNAENFGEASIVYWDEGTALSPKESWMGYVGHFVQVPWTGPGEKNDGCVYLGTSGCTVYKDRPGVCRDFSAWTCDQHEPDPSKATERGPSRVRLAVIP
jgi:Fe-S-cluster containining protein